MLARVFIKNLQRDYTKGKMLEFANLFGVTEEEIKRYVNGWAEKGLISRYNESGSLDKPPFIILNDEEYGKELLEILKWISASILHF